MPIQDIFTAVNARKNEVENLSIAEAEREIAANPDVLVVDLREIQERVELGAIPNSVHAPRGMLEFWASPASPYYRDWFQEHRRTIVYCAGGGRSVLAAIALKDMGFSNVAHIEAGFKGWKDAGKPVEDCATSSRWVRR